MWIYEKNQIADIPTKNDVMRIFMSIYRMKKGEKNKKFVKLY